MNRSDVDVIAIRTFWLIVLAAIFAVLLPGCGTNFEYKTTGPSSEIESALLSYTDLYAGRLGVKVTGKISENRPSSLEGVGALGWYEAGVAYYYRPAVAVQVSLAGEPCPDPDGRCELASGIAAHEVCHHDWRDHDMHHWCCMVKLGVRPTYPPPVTPGGMWPTCE